MSLIILGINHKTAPVELRERMAYNKEQLIHTLNKLYQQSWLYEIVIISTCNRTEWVAHINDADKASLVNWLIIEQGLTLKEADDVMYCHQDNDAVMHLMSVACGLDSMVFGEPQIFGQIKSAYSLAKDVGVISDQLEKLFQTTFATAKKVRSNTAIGRSSVSVAFIAVRLAKQIFAKLSDARVLLIGAGDTIERVAKHLIENNVRYITVLNRTVSNAERLAIKLEARAGHISEAPELLQSTDIVISSTASNLPIIGKGTVESALKVGKRRPLVMIDLAVPRDIEAEVGKLSDVYLYSVDDLQKVVDSNIKHRKDAANDANQMIIDATNDYLAWLKSLDAIDMIRQYRKHVNAITNHELHRAYKHLSKGTEPDIAIQQFATRLTNKLMHSPCYNMRKAGQQGKTDLLEVAKELLELES